MGAFVKLTDAILFVFFIFIAIGAPLIDSQIVLAREFFPDVLVDLKQWYGRELDYYLLVEKPSFFVGLVWLVLLFVWPLSLFNLYGLLGSKSWFPTTCLISGVAIFTTTVAVLSEIIGSGKAYNKLMMTYFSFMSLGILATLRGLLPTIANKPTNSKKKAT